MNQDELRNSNKTECSYHLQDDRPAFSSEPVEYFFDLNGHAVFSELAIYRINTRMNPGILWII